MKNVCILLLHITQVHLYLYCCCLLRRYSYTSTVVAYYVGTAIPLLLLLIT